MSTTRYVLPASVLLANPLGAPQDLSLAGALKSFVLRGTSGSWSVDIGDSALGPFVPILELQYQSVGNKPVRVLSIPTGWLALRRLSGADIGASVAVIAQNDDGAGEATFGQLTSSANIQTNDAAPTPGIIWTTGPNGTYTILVNVSAYNATTDESATALIRVLARKTAGVLQPIVDTDSLSSFGEFIFSFLPAIDGNNIVINCVGVALQDVNWRLDASFQFADA